MAKERVTITIDRDVNDRIKNLSIKEERSFSQQVNKILKEYQKEKEGN